MILIPVYVAVRLKNRELALNQAKAVYKFKTSSQVEQ